MYESFVIRACKLTSRTFTSVRTQKCHLLAVATTEVDVQVSDILGSFRLQCCRHVSKYLLTVFIPRYRIQLLFAEIVFAFE